VDLRPSRAPARGYSGSDRIPLRTLTSNILWHQCLKYLVGIYPYVTAERVKAYQQAYQQMVLLHLLKSPTSHRCESEYFVPKWIPPPNGWLMINVDASTLENPPHMGARVVVRDH